MNRKMHFLGVEQFLNDLSKLVLPEFGIDFEMAMESVIEQSQNVEDSTFNILISGQYMKDKNDKNFLFKTYNEDDSNKIISYDSYEILT